jgi:hypothetical protein
MKRVFQLLLIGSFFPACWLLMQAAHELGHVAGIIVTGGIVAKVVLHPLTISQTVRLGGFRPMLVVWAGPVVGVLLPLGLAWALQAAKVKWSFLARFFAGFCLIANGIYIGGGSFQAICDAGDLLMLGSPIWSLWLFGLIAIPLGLYLWHGLGPGFGLGRARGAVDRGAALFSCGLLVLVVVLEVVFSPRQ